MKLISGAVPAGTERVGKLKDIGVGDLPWTVLISNPGAGATVTFSIGPTATGPWHPGLSVTAEDGRTTSDASNQHYYQLLTAGATTGADFRVDIN